MADILFSMGGHVFSIDRNAVVSNGGTAGVSAVGNAVVSVGRNADFYWH